MLLLFFALVFWLQAIWDPSSTTRDGTHNPCIGRWSLMRWTTREVTWMLLLSFCNILILTVCLSTILVLCLYLKELNSYSMIFFSFLYLPFWLEFIINFYCRKRLYSSLLYFPKYSPLEIADISRKADVEHASVLVKSQFFHLSPFILVPGNGYKSSRLHIYIKL